MTIPDEQFKEFIDLLKDMRTIAIDVVAYSPKDFPSSTVRLTKNVIDRTSTLIADWEDRLNGKSR